MLYVAYSYETFGNVLHNSYRYINTEALTKKEDVDAIIDIIQSLHNGANCVTILNWKELDD